MIGFRIQLSSGETVTAGLSGLDTLAVTANSVIRDPRYQPPDDPPIDLTFYVGGLRRTEEGTQGAVQWLEKPLNVGDEVTIRVVDVDVADISPLRLERTIAEVTESGEKQLLAYLIRKYGLP
jgi:hypothetical protein